MKFEKELSIFDLFSYEEVCSGAIFTTYTFDPDFFEERVLSTLFDMRFDPQEDISRFLEEGREKLIESPCTVIVDQMHYTGQRLPFETLSYGKKLFHPKLILLKYSDHLTFFIGSGNLTKSGIGINSELFISFDLFFSENKSWYLISKIKDFLDKIVNDISSPHPTYDSFWNGIIDIKPKSLPKSRTPSHFLTSLSEKNMLNQFLDLIPDNQKIKKLILMAPFHENDKQDFDNSLIEKWINSIGRESELFLVFPWDNNPFSASTDTFHINDLDKYKNKLWAWLQDDKLEYISPIKLTDKTFWYLDQFRNKRRIDRKTIEDDLKSKVFYPISRVECFGPKSLINTLDKLEINYSIFLFPANHLKNGQTVRRPLHAKLCAIELEKSSYCMVGSPNCSKAAMLSTNNSPSNKSNVEAAYFFKAKSSIKMDDIIHRAIYCPKHSIQWKKKDFPKIKESWAKSINSAIYYPDERRLEIECNLLKFPQDNYKLMYKNKIIFISPFRPLNCMKKEPFDLDLDSNNLEWIVEDSSYFIPIIIENISELPFNPALYNIELEELIGYWGGRISKDRLKKEIERKNIDNKKSKKLPDIFRKDDDSTFQKKFDEELQPFDIFRVFYNLQKEIYDPSLSIGGLKAILDGPYGVKKIWKSIKDSDSSQLSKEEVWFYGAELYKSLSEDGFHFSNNNVQHKNELLNEFLRKLEKDLKKANPFDKNRRDTFFTFYNLNSRKRND